MIMITSNKNLNDRLLKHGPFYLLTKNGCYTLSYIKYK